MLNIELGGEFIYMASLLMSIKAKMLLPVLDEETEEVEDPRTQLIENLLEYQKFKELGLELSLKYSEHLAHFPKGQEMYYTQKSMVSHHRF